MGSADIPAAEWRLREEPAAETLLVTSDNLINVSVTFVGQGSKGLATSRRGVLDVFESRRVDVAEQKVFHVPFLFAGFGRARAASQSL